MLGNQVERQACVGIADRVVDLPGGQSPRIAQIGARQIGAVKLCPTQLGAAEIGAVE